MDYFKIEEFEELKKYAGKKYDASLPVYNIFEQYLEKLKYFVQYISEKTGIDFVINREERINKQAGRGATYNNFTEYLLVGFCPSESYVEKSIFIKIALHNLSTDPKFTLEFDRDFSSTKKADEIVSEKVLELKKINTTSFRINEIINLGWSGLFDKSKPIIEKLVNDYQSIYDEFYSEKSAHFGILTNMGWNSFKWADNPSETDLKTSKAFGYVSDQNEMHECLNFGHEKFPCESDGMYIANTSSFNKTPQYKEDVKIVILSSTNPERKRKIVGFYAFPIIGDFSRKASHKYYKRYPGGNLKSLVEHIVYFENYIDADDPDFLPNGKSLSKQRFNYLTIENVRKIISKAIINNPDNFKLKQISDLLLSNSITKTFKNMKDSKNIILYGPPGTGKTYNSIDKAVQISSAEFTNNHSNNKKIFDELRMQGQIEFITFHQSYSYEDFMIGLRPDINDSAQLKFIKNEGVFYNICNRARRNFEAIDNFNDVFNFYFEPLKKDTNLFLSFHLKGNAGNFKVYWDDKSKIFAINTPAQNNTMPNRINEYSIPIIKEIFNKKTDLNIKEKTAWHETYLKPIALFLKEKSLPKNYVLIIDEINRANISKVFGELITLLEDDKRLGEENELKITLPNGEKDFGIPPNLYIVGTMNTADKSIALIDVALRRRFDFIGFYPTNDLIDKLISESKLSPEKGKLINHINKIVYEKRNKSADFLIGHAYFMNEKPIEEILSNKIIPLLMEYFAGKAEMVETIFNGSGYNVKYNSDFYKWIISKV